MEQKYRFCHIQMTILGYDDADLVVQKDKIWLFFAHLCPNCAKTLSNVVS